MVAAGAAGPAAGAAGAADAAAAFFTGEWWSFRPYQHWIKSFLNVLSNLSVVNPTRPTP